MLPTSDPFRTGVPPLAMAATAAEHLGFESGWVGDHLSFHSPMLEAVCAAAVAATHTARLRVGFGIMQLALRNPVWAAKQLGTIEALAPGRIVLGVGVGGENPQEFVAAGVPTAGRGARLDEALHVVRESLRGRPCEHVGRYLRVSSPALEPVPGARLPLVVGGRSDAALARAGRLGDGWLALRADAARLRRDAQRVAEYAAEANRPAPQTQLMVFVNVADRRAANDEAARMFSGQYGLPTPLCSSRRARSRCASTSAWPRFASSSKDLPNRSQ
jgi:alkanesulfonate monooxygenase SsuD/methylene tetrahydromethanopterin reductase-like flavin-dependent oxidoreductase (luciferase family)